MRNKKLNEQPRFTLLSYMIERKKKMKITQAILALDTRA